MTRPPAELSSAVRTFLYSCIDSIDQLETLLTIRSTAKPWTVREASHVLGMSAEVARANLEALVARGLIRVRLGDQLQYWYEPRSEQLARFVDAVAKDYDLNRSALLTFVATHATRSLRSFADAFKLGDAE